ncbi:alpha/beta hydrolase [Micromonospora sp. KC721]|uniref:alpha/beta hydrolase family protein n=1 Tax=Micromonospora sp. KC721 TaxID=2530380 RepID=UPI001042E152|nr:alpha/beta hydrolase [Micromonospora sp. KC721]TDB80603.1 alpha/beta hydrolase [Micromonospora sp. KC721]
MITHITHPFRRTGNTRPTRLIVTVAALSVAAPVVAPTPAALANTGTTPSGGTRSAPTAPAAARPSASPYVPEPTGPHPVGATALHLRDTSRHDPWVAEATARELMVSLWYPTRSTGRLRAQYMTPMESELLLRDAGITSVPYDVLSRTRTNASTDSAPAGRKRSLPLVVLSPGFTKPRSVLTGLAEDLASNGYVVAAVEHTYESVGTSFPDGRVTTCVACQSPDRTEAFWKKLTRGRAADVSFVIDQLTGTRRKWKGAPLIDPSRIAMVGHSAGGAGTQAAMVADPRIDAGIDIDGLTYDDIPDSGLARPFLFLGRQANFTPGMPSAARWERDWPRLTQWKRWLVVAGTVHASFTDVALLAEQVGIGSGADLPPIRSIEITRAYTRAFLDLHLRNRIQPVLDGSSPRYPEVMFCVPERRTCQ